MTPLRILVCVNRDIYSFYALTLLRRALSSHHISIMLSEQVGNMNVSKTPAALHTLALLEKHIPFDVLAPLFAHEKIRARLDFSTLAELLNAPLFLTGAWNKSELTAHIKEAAPDLIISIRFGKIFTQEMASIPTHGIINLHSGMLPQYRGVMATFRAMMEEEKEIGCTLHTIIDASIDTGAVIATTLQKLDKNRSYLGQVASLYPEGVRLIENALEMIARGKFPPTTSQCDEGNYYSFPTAEELIEFSEKGFVLYSMEEYRDLLLQIFRGTRAE